MNKILAAFTAALALSLPLSAQTCQLTESPTVRGFKIGQRYEESVKIIGSAEAGKDVGDDGVRRVHLTRSDLRRDEFKGVMQARLTYTDDLLAEIEITYDYTTKWESDKEFADAIAESLSLPKEGWKRELYHTLTCKGFSVSANATGRQLTIYKTGLDEEIEKRQREAERKKRERFKP